MMMIDQLADEVMARLSPEQRARIAALGKEEYRAALHFSLGMQIRNEFLYKAGVLEALAAAPGGDYRLLDADWVSALIIERLWERLRE